MAVDNGFVGSESAWLESLRQDVDVDGGNTFSIYEFDDDIDGGAP
jgi:hypothetical protein